MTELENFFVEFKKKKIPNRTLSAAGGIYMISCSTTIIRKTTEVLITLDPIADHKFLRDVFINKFTLKHSWV